MNSLTKLQFDRAIQSANAPSLEISNIQFIERLCLHVQQLCLTKTSLLTISSLSQKYKQKVANNVLSKILFSDFFEEIYEFCNQTILRLKKLDNKKFQPLIKRKLTDIFGCIMRYSYDLKIIAVADKANEMKRLIKINLSIQSLSLIVLYHANVKSAFLRLKEEGFGRPKLNFQKNKMKWANFLSRINHRLSTKQQMQKRYFLNVWHLNVKLASYVTNQVVVEKSQQFYTQLLNVINSPSQTHFCIVQLLKQLCRIDKISYFKYSNNLLISYIYQEYSYLSSERSQLSQQDNCIKQIPQGIYKESIESEQMITESLNSSSSRLYIPLKHTSVIGLIVMTYENCQLDWKQIQLLLNYCEHISRILGRIYQTQSKIQYYSQTTNSENQIAKKLWGKYVQWNPSHFNFKLFLDSVFQQMNFIQVQIGLIKSQAEKFYDYPQKQSTIDRQCLSLMMHEFKTHYKNFLSVKKQHGIEIIIPLRQEKQMIGYVRYVSNIFNNTPVFIEIMRSFTTTVIKKLKNEQSLLKGTHSNRIIQMPGDQNKIRYEKIKQVLAAQTFDQIESVVSKIMKQFNFKLYACIVWKYNQQYFVRTGNQLTIIANQNPVYNILNIDKESFQILCSFDSYESTFIRKFPCFPQNQLYQYQNKSKNIVIHQLKFNSCIILTGYFEQVIGQKEATYASSIQPRIPYEDLMQIGKNIDIRTRKGYLNQDFNTNIFALNQEIQLINANCVKQDISKKSESSVDPHGKYLCYQIKQMNLKLLEITESYEHFQNRIKGFKQLMINLKQNQENYLKQTNKHLKLKQKVIIINREIIQGETNNLRQIVRKFNKNKKLKEQKISKIKMILSQTQWSKKYLVQSFHIFKRQSKTYKLVIIQNEQKTKYLVEKLNKIFFINVFQQIRNKVQRKRLNEISKSETLKSVLKYRQQKNKQITSRVLFLLKSNKLKHQAQIKNRKISNLIFLSNLFQTKRFSHLSQIFNSAFNQSHQFTQAISTIIQQVSLVRMTSCDSLLSFVEARLFLHIQKHFSNQNIEIKFKILKLKEHDIKIGSSYSSMRNNQNTIILNFQSSEYIIASIEYLSMGRTIVRQIQRLLVAVRVALLSIIYNIRRKLLLFFQLIKQYQNNNLQRGILAMYDNLAKCYKVDLSRSCTTLKQSEQMFGSLPDNEEADKQNSQIHNKVKQMKQKIIQNNKTIQSLKLENKIKKKTFSAAQIQHKDMAKQQINHQIKQAFTKIGACSEFKQLLHSREIDGKLLGSGIRSINRVFKDRQSIFTKECFNRIADNICNN